MRAGNRIAQGLPLNTIIISIIVVVVLVVIILIFTGNLSSTNQTLQSCAAQGGTCVASEDACSGTVTDAECPAGQAGSNTCCVTV